MNSSHLAAMSRFGKAFTALGILSLPLRGWTATTITVDANVPRGANTIFARHVSQGSSEQEKDNTRAYWQNMGGRFKEMKANLVRFSPGSRIQVTGAGATLNVEFGNLDTIVDGIIAEGGEPFMTLGVGSNFARTDEDTKKIIRTIVSKYKNRVRYWEVYNEPNHPIWGLPSVEEYKRYYDLVVDAIKASPGGADPTAKVGGMALTAVNTEVGPGSPSPKVKDVWLIPFLDHVKQHGKPLDFVSWHFYNNGQGPHNRPHKDLADEISQVRTLLNNRGLIAEIMITEYGLSGGEITPRLDDNYNAAHTIEFIDYITRTFASAPVKLFFFQPKDPINYTFEVPPVDGIRHVDRFHGGTGLISYDNYPKPVYNALKMYSTMPGTKVQHSLSAAPTGVGAMAAISGSGAGDRLEVLVWNNSNVPQEVDVNSRQIPFASGSSKEYSRSDISERSGNAKYNVLTAELSLANDLDTSTPATLQKTILFTADTFKTPVFTLGPHSVSKLVFKAAPSKPAIPVNVRVNQTSVKTDGAIVWTSTPRYQNNIVRWDSSANATAYNLRRDSDPEGSFSRVVARNITGNLYVDPQVSAAANYHYKVEAVNAAGASNLSAASNAGSWTIFNTNRSVDAIAITPLTYLNRFDSGSSIQQLQDRASTFALQNEQLVNTITGSGAEHRASLTGFTLSNGIIEFDLKIDGDGGRGGMEFVNARDTYRVLWFASGSARLQKNGADIVPNSVQSDTNVEPRNGFQHIAILYSTATNTIVIRGQGTDYITYTPPAGVSALTPVTAVRAVTNSSSIVRYDNLEINHIDSFQDNFATVAMANWKSKDTSWSIVSNRLQQSSTAAGKKYAGCSLLTMHNGTVEAHVQILGNSNAGDHWAGLAVKRTNPDDDLRTPTAGYEIYIRKNPGGTGGLVGIYDNLAAATIGTEVATSIDPVANQVQLKAVFKNDLIEVWATKSGTTASALPLLSRRRLSFLSGSVALITNNASAHFDNVKLSK